MRADEIPDRLARRVSPRAMSTYATGLGLLKLAGVNGRIAVYHLPTDRAEQVVIPLDDGLDDYGAMVSTVVARLALFDDRPASEVLEHLLLPPADLFEFRDRGAQAGNGTLPLDQAANLLIGIRKGLLAQAHSVIKPQAYHPRLGRGDAELFVDACRFGQTRRETFAMTVACPLDAVPTEGALLQNQPPFARQVTSELMRALGALSRAADANNADTLLSRDVPLISANLCEAVVLMKPANDRPSLEVSAAWSRATAPPDPAGCPALVRLDAETFAIAEYVGPLLRARQKPEKALFIGYVDVLRGVPQEENRPAGEVILSLLIGDESIRARADLNPDDYLLAATAHVANAPVLLRAELHRLPRLSRLGPIESFKLARQDDGPAPKPSAVEIRR